MSMLFAALRRGGEMDTDYVPQTAARFAVFAGTLRQLQMQRQCYCWKYGEGRCRQVSDCESGVWS